MSLKTNQSGLTLLELVLALAVIVILAVVGIPNVEDMGAKRRLQGAVRALEADLRFARSEAIKRNEHIQVTFKDPDGLGDDGNENWCYGMAVDTECDCTDDVPACSVGGVTRIRQGSSFQDVRLSSLPSFSGGNPFTTFDPTHGTAGNGTVKLVSSLDGEDIQFNVVLSSLGRVRACSDSGNSSHKYGFDECP
jgi:type IV fimbrial biogenesis protein FimT